MDINFPEVDTGLSKEYRSVFGPHFTTRTQMAHCNNKGIRGAVRRLTCVRKPEVPMLHERLRDNQYSMHLRIPDLLVKWIVWYRSGLGFITAQKFDATTERNIWCDQPHPKRMLRQETRRLIDQNGRASMNARVKLVDYKCKTGELLPLGKYPRAIGDLTAPGSTALGYYMDWVKEQFEQPFVVGNASCRFIKTPESSVMAEVFRNLINPVGLYFCFFSDDACISAQCTDGNFTANLDISACDGSNFDPVFNLLKTAMRVDPRYYNDIEDAFKQCKTKCVVKQVEGGKGKVFLKPNGYVLYSGSVLTTSINNMANTLIFMHIVSLLQGRVVSKQELREIIVTAGEQAGYMLKIDECKRHGDIQFLKHSPAISGDKILPYLNLGVLMRGFGTIVGELPGKKKLGIDLRARIFNSDVIKSWKHAGNTSIKDAFSNKIVDKTFHYVPPESVWRSNSSFPDLIPNEELCNRYQLTNVELEELIYLIKRSDVGMEISSHIIDKIMKKDYGYE